MWRLPLVFLFYAELCFLKFVKYFEEINTGIDILIQNEDKQIELSAELEFMEQKLNTLKRTLEKREHDAKLAEQRKMKLLCTWHTILKHALTSVIGYLILLDGHQTCQESKGKVRAYHVRQSVSSGTANRRVFEITRYNLQTITLTKKHIDLYYMLVQMTDEFYPQLAAKGKQVVLHVSEDLTVFGDADKLARVFNNILKNATAYSKDDSVIDITANLSEDVVSIVFKNDGNIPKDKTCYHI